MVVVEVRCSALLQADLMGLDRQSALANLKKNHHILHRMWKRVQQGVKDSVDPDGDTPVGFFLAKMVSETLRAQEGDKCRSQLGFWGFSSEVGAWDRLVKSYQRKGKCHTLCSHACRGPISCQTCWRRFVDSRSCSSNHVLCGCSNTTVETRSNCT